MTLYPMKIYSTFEGKVRLLNYVGKVLTEKEETRGDSDATTAEIRRLFPTRDMCSGMGSQLEVYRSRSRSQSRSVDNCQEIAL